MIKDLEKRNMPDILVEILISMEEKGCSHCEQLYKYIELMYPVIRFKRLRDELTALNYSARTCNVILQHAFDMVEELENCEIEEGYDEI